MGLRIIVLFGKVLVENVVNSVGKIFRRKEKGFTVTRKPLDLSGVPKGIRQKGKRSHLILIHFELKAAT